MEKIPRTFLLYAFFLVVQLEFSSTFICPIYSSRQQSNRFIRNCQTNCSFERVRTDRDACLGVFQNISGRIFIKQLGVVHRDEICSKSAECFLDSDEIDRDVFSCCCSTTNCTLNWKTKAKPTTTTTTTTKRISIEENRFFFLLVVFLFAFVVVLLAFIFLLVVFSRRKSSKEKNERKSSSIDNLFHSAQQYFLGKNSLIYKSIYHGEFVALKVYENTHVAVWTNEMILLKSIEHESIIKILSDGQFNSNWFLILPFYPNGNLQTFLRNSTRMLTINECLNFIRSLVSAVAYLHLGENQTGLTIVHRDIKSSNILVGKNAEKICLTDFGMAAALPRILKEKDFVQIGTMRYMAPELLEGVIAHTREALCSVDIYALSLVIWEIFSQTEFFLPSTYRLPYDEYLVNANDRSAFSLQLYDIVVTRRLRPNLSRPLNNVENRQFKLVEDLSTLIEACWTGDPDVRMNAETLKFKVEQIF